MVTNNQYNMDRANFPGAREPSDLVARYLARGWTITPVRAGDKRPVRDGWQKERLSAEELRPYFAPGANCNIGLLTGTPSGHVIDTDYDDHGAIIAGAFFMPPTEAVFGRASKPRSHALYISNCQTTTFADPLINTASDGRAMLLELRADGHQTVLPGSTHPSGEAIAWNLEGEPAPVEADTLLKAAGRTAAAALIARYWNGNRQFKAMALMGALLRAGWSEADATTFLQVVCQVAGDEETRDRLKTAPYTAQKLEDRQPATGWTALADLFGDGGEKLVEQARTWLDAGDKGSKKGQSQATSLVGLATDSGAVLFHDEQDVAYVTIPMIEHQETLKVRSQRLRSWLTARYLDAHGHVPGNSAVQEAVHALESLAQIRGERRTVHHRIGELDGAYYLDLGDERWRAVRITDKGWEIVPHPPGLFRRSKNMGALPDPVRGGTVDRLRPFVNVASEHDWKLLVGWVLGALRPSGPYAVLNISGEQGAAKTTAGRVARRLIDPNTALTLAAPHSERDLRVSAFHHHALVFDNLSSVSGDLSDALCRLATGGGFATRALYTDDEEAVFEGERPVILTGIDEVATKSDLLDRSMLIRLPAIRDDQRKSEQTFWDEFEAALPSILGGLCDAVCTAMARLPLLPEEEWPRMADFAKWVEAASPALGWERGDFLRAYRANRQIAHDVALESSLFAAAVIRFMQGKRHWSGTATELLDEARGRTPGVMDPERDKSWPKTARGVTAQLGRLSPNLRAIGIDYVPSVREPGGKRRVMGLVNDRPEPKLVKRIADPMDAVGEWAWPLVQGDIAS